MWNLFSDKYAVFVFSRVRGLVDKDSCVNIRCFDFSEVFNSVPHNISI